MNICLLLVDSFWLRALQKSVCASRLIHAQCCEIVGAIY
jgi:hypothetical protein